MNEVIIEFNGQFYIATYNEQTGYYEIELKAPEVGGVYEANIKLTDILGNQYEDNQIIQVFAKEKIHIETNKVFMWIFDYQDFTVKDIVEISDYNINIDEETNANTIIKVLKKTKAKSNDIVAIKKNGNFFYWGVIDNIKNENGKILYEFSIKYIINIFNEKIPLSKNVGLSNIEDGVYKIRSSLDINKIIDVYNGNLENETNIQIWGDNNTDNQKWKIKKEEDGFYTITNLKTDKCLEVANGNYVSGTNVQQYQNNNGDAQRWSIIQKNKSCYVLKPKKANNLCLDVENGNPKEGTNIWICTQNGTSAQEFYFDRIDEQIIKDVGIEDYIAKMINDYFINTGDELIDRKYIEVRVKTHTKLQTSVTNVTDNMYYLTTWMTNCTQSYNINYDFFIENKKFIIEIENRTEKKKLIDTQAQRICNYEEVFDTNIISKVEVTTRTNKYELYLLNDRTTTTDSTNENRAKGKTERIFVEKFEEAEQKALDIFKSNKYNHKITFDLYDELIKVGTPIAIKTKESMIYDTYISAISITPKKFISYTCGNIRTRFIDKLLKERNK